MEIKSLPDSITSNVYRFSFYYRFLYFWNRVIICPSFIASAIQEFKTLDKNLRNNFVVWYILKLGFMLDKKAMSKLEIDIWYQILWTSLLLMLASKEVRFTRINDAKTMRLEFPDTNIEHIMYVEAFMDDLYPFIKSNREVFVKTDAGLAHKFKWTGTRDLFSIIKEDNLTSDC